MLEDKKHCIIIYNYISLFTYCSHVPYCFLRIQVPGDNYMPDGSGPQGVLVHVPLWPGHSEEALWVLELENGGRAEPRPTPWMVQEEDGVETAREIQGVDCQV